MKSILKVKAVAIVILLAGEVRSSTGVNPKRAPLFDDVVRGPSMLKDDDKLHTLMDVERGSLGTASTDRSIDGSYDSDSSSSNSSGISVLRGGKYQPHSDNHVTFMPIEVQTIGEDEAKTNWRSLSPRIKKVFKVLGKKKEQSEGTSSVLKNRGSPTTSSLKKYFVKSPSVPLPPMRNARVYGEGEEYDKWLSQGLWDEGGEFEEVIDTANDIIGKLVPLNRNVMTTTLFEGRMQDDLVGNDFSDFLNELRRYSEYPEAEDSGVDNRREATKSMVVCSLGRASTMTQDEVDKVAMAPQRVVFTMRDLFYYPGMLKVSAFFNHLFDPSRASGFFYRFVTSVYSGVYGPRRRDLFYIARIQDIPDSVITDELLRRLMALSTKIEYCPEEFMSEELRDKVKELYLVTRLKSIPEKLISADLSSKLKSMFEDESLVDTRDEAELGSKVEEQIKRAKEAVYAQMALERDEIEMQITHVKMTFLDPTMRSELVNKYGKEALWYKELQPVPKTLEDVLDGTVVILQAYWCKRNKTVETPSEVVEAMRMRVYDESNIAQLQSLYLGVFNPIGVKKVFDGFMGCLKGWKRDQRLEGASFLYAAYIQSLATTEGPSPEKMVKTLTEMGAMKNLALERIRDASVKVAEIDLDTEDASLTDRSYDDYDYNEKEEDYFEF